MTRTAAWNSCNRVLDERWRESEWQAHRDRVEFIQSANSVSTHAFSSALAASAHPHRIHSSQLTSSHQFKLQPRAKRQKQIEHLNLIQKIIALDNAKSRYGHKKKHKTRPFEKPTTISPKDEKNTIVVSDKTHSSHKCLHPLAEVPHSAVSHILYTRNSATMKNNFAEYNAPTMLHSSNAESAAGRVRSRAQSQILLENTNILRRILSAKTTIDRSVLRKSEEKHTKVLSVMSRHNSSPQLLQHQPQKLRTSRSHYDLREKNTEVFYSDTGITTGIRVDLISHLTPELKRRSGSQTSRNASTCPLPLHSARNNVRTGRISESLVSRIRNMTIESQV